MPFGFGKALDVLRDGDAVTREHPAMSGSLRLEPMVESDGIVTLSRFVWTTDEVLGIRYVDVWSPTHADLLAEDWDYVDRPGR